LRDAAAIQFDKQLLNTLLFKPFSLFAVNVSRKSCLQAVCT